MTDNQEILGTAIGCIPSGLFIVTTTQHQKNVVMLASWVQQAGFTPPIVTIAVAKGRDIASLLNVGSPLVVNILEKGQGKLIGHFAKSFAPEADPLAEISTAIAPSGQPYLQEAIAYLDAEVTQVVDVGDHSIVFAQINSGEKLRDGEPATHTRKNGFKY
jgi:flavin reductase (DIM6/NTAB) family NADH-FMN oxidoreductase RutF